MVGLILWIGLWFVAFNIRGNNENPEIWIAQAGLLSLLVFGMFSYPSHILSIKICGMVYLAILGNFSKKLVTIPEWSKSLKWSVSIIMALFAINLLWQVYKVFQATRDWRDAQSYYGNGAYRISLDKYEKALPVFAFEGDFLCNYGKALSVAGEHKEAIAILGEAKKYLNNTIIQIALGDSYQALGMLKEAEDEYLIASHMLPDRFYPKYLLAKLYLVQGEEEKMKSLARYLVNKKPKIPSPAVDEIKAEMKMLLE